MGVVGAVMRRNLTLFSRDRMNVFFSLLAAIILFGLYTMFLGELQISDLQESFPTATKGDIKAFVDTWMFAGLISMTAITTGLSAMGIVVEDAATGRSRDFLVAPIRRGQLVLGYFFSALVIAMSMTLLVFALSLLYLFAVSGVVVPVGSVLRTLGWIVLTGASFAALSAFVTSFVATPGAYAALSTIVGTVLGFLTGAYIPVGSFPEGVRTTVNALPFAQASMLMRDDLAAETLNTLVAGDPDARDALRAYFGMDILIGDRPVTAPLVIALLLTIAVVFTVLAAFRIRARMTMARR